MSGEGETVLWTSGPYQLVERCQRFVLLNGARIVAVLREDEARALGARLNPPRPKVRKVGPTETKER